MQNLPAALAACAALSTLIACSAAAPLDYSGPVSDWSDYGGTRAGERFSPLTQINASNVADLDVAWTYHTGDVSDGRGEIPSTSAFENTPIVVWDTLYLCTPFNRVLALDPETGRERWAFDPEIDLSARYANQLVCRGVTAWEDARAEPGSVCARRIFTATNDARLFAIDAQTGQPCADFGEAGQVALRAGVGELAWSGEYQVTSPPAVIWDRVVVGGAIGDNQRTDAPSGVVRGFDARTGALRWAWDPVPDDLGERERSDGGYVLGTANVWAPMSVDEARDLVFVPTGNTSPDYYGGHRGRLEEYAASVVALRGSTGERVWHFRTVHHDLWDFDVPAQPTLSTLRLDGRQVPVVIQTTKMGHIFVLHRETGVPVFPVEERSVPASDVPGEKTSPTQPFPTHPAPLARASLRADEAWGVTPWDRGACRDRIASLRFDGVFTPPSLQGSLMIPGNAGGSNWGGLAFDPLRQRLIARITDLAWVVTMIPAADYEQERAAHPGVEIGAQRGTPFAMRREMLVSPLGLPCNPPPWGSVVAVDLASGDVEWRVPHGTIRDLSPVPLPIELGVPGIGGPVITAGGLVFIAGAMDSYLRAFDAETGETLWKDRLPAGAQATPMTYRLDSTARQFVVIAAGGHGRAGTPLGDSVIAYALPSDAD